MSQTFETLRKSASGLVFALEPSLACGTESHSRTRFTPARFSNEDRKIQRSLVKRKGDYRFHKTNLSISNSFSKTISQHLHVSVQSLKKRQFKSLQHTNMHSLLTLHPENASKSEVRYYLAKNAKKK
jgi:hypothetical protein